MTAWVAAGLAAAAVGALLPPRTTLATPEPGPRTLTAGRTVAGLVVAAVAWTRLSATSFALVVVLGGAGFAVAGAVRRRREGRLADLRAEQVLGACEALASDLGAGQPPQQCLERLAQEWSYLAPVAVAGRMGADVPSALRSLAERPGAGQLRTLASSWAVAYRTGSGLAASVDRAADTIRAQRRTARLVSAELASARATARMLAVLPVGVLVLGSGIGGDPVGFLLSTPAGVGCLGVGLALSFAGMRWLEAIADRVLRR